MSPRPTRSFVLAAALTLVATAVGTWLWHRQRALRAYESKVSAAAAANHRLYRLLLDRRAPSAARASRNPAPTTTLATASVGSPDDDAAARSTWMNATLARVPEYAAFLRARWQCSAIQEYGEWFRQLNVPPERLAMIKQAVADGIEQRQRRYGALVASGIDEQSPAFKQTAEHLSDDMHASLAQILTEEEYDNYRNFERAADWVQRLPEIQAYLDDNGAPALIPEQRRALVEASVAVSQQKSDPKAVQPGSAERMKYEKIAALASQALSPAQREALNGYMAFLSERNRLKTERLNP